AWDRFLRPNIDWMKLAWGFFAFSAIFIIDGLTAFVVKSYQREMLDIEFASGTAVQFELKQPMDIEKVREQLKPFGNTLPSPSVVSVGAGEKTYEVVTDNADRRQVQDAVLKAFQGDLVVEVPSTFGGVGATTDAALNDKQIIPIQRKDNEPFTVANFSPRQADNYVGGAAIVLSDLDPPLKPSEIEARLKRQS